MPAQYMWVYSPTPVKLDKWEKQQLLDRVASLIEKSQRLKHVVHRTSLRGGRLYLYNLYEPSLPKNNEFHFIKPSLMANILRLRWRAQPSMTKQEKSAHWNGSATTTSGLKLDFCALSDYFSPHYTHNQTQTIFASLSRQ